MVPSAEFGGGAGDLGDVCSPLGPFAWAARLMEVYGAEVPKPTITAITDRVLNGMAAWQSRLLTR